MKSSICTDRVFSVPFLFSAIYLAQEVWTPPLIHRQSYLVLHLSFMVNICEQSYRQMLQFVENLWTYFCVCSFKFGSFYSERSTSLNYFYSLSTALDWLKQHYIITSHNSTSLLNPRTSTRFIVNILDSMGLPLKKCLSLMSYRSITRLDYNSPFAEFFFLDLQVVWPSLTWTSASPLFYICGSRGLTQFSAS